MKCDKATRKLQTHSFYGFCTILKRSTSGGGGGGGGGVILPPASTQNKVNLTLAEASQITKIEFLCKNSFC